MWCWPEAARPIDLFEKPLPEGYPAVWSLSVKTPYGPMTILAVFNLEEKTKKYKFFILFTISSYFSAITSSAV
jgi:hypothetical protein